MNVNKIAPSFRGLIQFKKEKISVNTDHVMTIEEAGVPGKVNTFIKLSNGKTLNVPYSYNSVVHAYEIASRDKSSMYPVTDYNA